MTFNFRRRELASTGEETAMRNNGLLNAKLRRGASTAALAVMAGLLTPSSVFADITNTVTATGSSPGHTDDVTAQGNAAVKVLKATPGVTMTKTPTFTDTGAAGASVGDVITYTYDVTNSGNTYLKNVSVSDVMDGSGSLSAITLASPSFTHNNTTTASTDNGTDAVFDLLAPGDVAHFKATYTVTAQDILTDGGGTGKLSNTATVTSIFDNGTTQTTETNTATAEVPLETVKAMTVAKSASPSTGVKAGDVVTYTYVVTNTGTSNITNIKLTDTHNASGAAPVPSGETLSTDAGTTGDSTDATANDGIWSKLAPGDAVTFTATYTVTQQDVDTLQ